MKILLYVLGALVALVAIVFVSQIIASESAEVVVLTSQGPEGAEETRLWVVDLDGIQYLRASPDSGWYERLLADPEVKLERDGETASYRAETRLERVAEINSLMQQKYAWRDSYIELLLGGRDDAIPVALLPI
jgi:hypothetical protein